MSLLAWLCRHHSTSINLKISSNFCLIFPFGILNPRLTRKNITVLKNTKQKLKTIKNNKKHNKALTTVLKPHVFEIMNALELQTPGISDLIHKIL